MNETPEKLPVTSHLFCFATNLNNFVMIDLIRSRRSIRKYTQQLIESDKLELFKETVLRAPSSRNSNACKFIFVDNLSMIEKLAHCKMSGATALQTAPLAVVILANESQTVAWIEDCSIASILLQITAHSLGLGSCWIQIRGRSHHEEKTSETYVKEILNIPDELRVLSIISLGYPQNMPEGRPFGELDFNRIYCNKF